MSTRHRRLHLRTGAGTQLPELEIVDNVPADLDQLVELDQVRTRLIERVRHHVIEPSETAENPGRWPFSGGTSEA